MNRWNRENKVTTATTSALFRAVAAALLLGGSITSHAATMGHWKFEPDAFLTDSSGNADLTVNGGVPQVTYPSAGRGGDFPAGHQAGAELGGTGQYFGADIGALTGDITVEAFIHRDSNAADWGQLIVGQFSAGNINSGSWSFEVRVNGNWGTEAGELVFGTPGQGGIPILSGLVVDLNKDYYVAAAVDMVDGSATFFTQNLTDGGELLSSTVAHSRTGLNSYATAWIGETPDGYNYTFDGIIDEVRISDGVLGQHELLVSAVPLPAGAWLFASAIGLIAGFRARKTR